MMEVSEAGVQSTIQSSRRLGHRHLGIPWSGAADLYSLALANRLCGNPEDAAALEITFGPFTCRFRVEATIAVTGAPADVLIDEAVCQQHRSLRIKKDSVLKIGAARSGARIMLAVSGGFEAETAFGSASSYLPAGFGGLAGRALKPGDRLSISPEGGTADGLQTPAELVPEIAATHLLRVTQGPEWEALQARDRRRFYEAPFFAARQIDRMGVRLKRNPLSPQQGQEQIRSAAVAPGTLQLPPGGVPILLGPDAQVTGGYPRIASVISADLWRIGQIRPGDRVRFFCVSQDEAALVNRRRARLTEGWCGSGWLTGSNL
jgi:biotin-dependent carboxylase-like uncharacterized protein